MMKTGKVEVHFIVGGKHWARRLLFHVPRTGDEVRFNGNKCFTVKRLVWLMDEEDYPYERCNIELVKTI